MSEAISLFNKPGRPQYSYGQGVWSDKRLDQMSGDEFNDYYNKVAENKRRNDLLGNLTIRDTSNSNSGGNTGINSNSSNNSLSVGGIGGIDDVTKSAKDLAQFRLGLDFQQMDKSAGLREQESANNFGRTTKLTDQTYGWQRNINADTQNALTQRNTDTLNKQSEMQKTGIEQDNFNTRRAIGLATRRIGGR